MTDLTHYHHPNHTHPIWGASYTDLRILCRAPSWHPKWVWWLWTFGALELGVLRGGERALVRKRVRYENECWTVLILHVDRPGATASELASELEEWMLLRYGPKDNERRRRFCERDAFPYSLERAEREGWDPLELWPGLAKRQDEGTK